MTKAKKGVKRAAKKKVKRKKAGKKSGKRSPKRTPTPERPVRAMVAGEEPPLEPDRYDDHRGHWVIPNQPIYKMVRTSGPLSGVFAFAMREFERQSRWLRALSQGILIMFRMPGGFIFEDEELPDGLGDRLQTFDRDLLFKVLERTLVLVLAESKSILPSRLRKKDKDMVREIMSEVAGDQPYRHLRLSVHVERTLKRLQTNELLNLVALCFDLLVMVPVLQERTAALSKDDPRRGAGR